ncbi:MAG: hypothetical protein ABR500_10590 [Dermatophilaceae bacterium]
MPLRCWAVPVWIEASDEIFAVACIPAIVAVAREAFRIFTASAVATLGPRGVSFLLADLIDCFACLRVDLCLGLLSVGVRVLLKAGIFRRSRSPCRSPSPPPAPGSPLSPVLSQRATPDGDVGPGRPRAQAAQQTPVETVDLHRHTHR